MTSNDSALSQPDNLWELKQVPPVLAFLSVAYTIVFALSIVGNAVVIATVYRIPSMHTAINYFICNLSTADILVAIFCLPLNLISSAFANWVAGETLCRALTYLQGVAVAASVTTLSVIAFDRYLAVCRPLRRHFSKKQAIAFLAIIWTYGLLLLLPWVLNFDLVNYRGPNNRTYLLCANKMEPLSNQAYQLGVIFCLLYASPMVFIAVCYGLVAQKLSRRTAQQEEFLRKSSTAHDRKQMSRLVKMLVTVVLIFAISWLPLHLVSVLYYIDAVKQYVDSVGPGLASILQWLGISNCCVNPWIYCAFSKNYRTNFLNTLRCNFVLPGQNSTQRSCANHHLLSNNRSLVGGQGSLRPSPEHRKLLQQQQQEQQQQQQSSSSAAAAPSDGAMAMVQLNFDGACLGVGQGNASATHQL